MLIDIQYIKQNRREGTPDALYIIWKNLDTKEKFVRMVEKPSMDIYFSKPDKRNFTHNKNYEHIENLDVKTVRYSAIPYAIAEDMGQSGRDIINDAFNTKDYSKIKTLYKYPYTFGSDYDIRAWYRYKWIRQFDNERVKELDKGYLDIEVDGLLAPGMPKPTTCPINAVTLINQTKKEVWTFALMTQEYRSDRRNMTPEQLKKDDYYRELYASQEAQINDVIENLDSFKEELHAMFDESYGVLDYNIKFYHDERTMIAHIFSLINLWKLDMIGIWNMGFDIPYFIERMEFLGMEPAEIMCHKDFKYKECYYKKDTRNFNIENKSDFFKLSSYTIFVDQMINYAAIRKGGAKLRSYKLTSIAQSVIKDKKLNYSDDGDIKTIAYTNFKLFLMYNIKDVLLQYGIEQKTIDMDSYYVGSYRNATPYESVYKQTVKLRNVQYLSFMKQGLVPGNNINTSSFEPKQKVEDEDDEDDEGFEGALVADPVLNDYIGLPLYGKPSNNIFSEVIDMDMSAFYPNSIIAMNIDPSTLIFKCIVSAAQFIDGDVKYNGMEKLEDREADLGKDVFDNVQTHNPLYTGHKWFNMPTVYDVYTECVKKLGGKHNGD